MRIECNRRGGALSPPEISIGLSSDCGRTRWSAPTILMVLFLIASPAFAASDSITLYDADGISQAGRPVTMGRAFAQGDIRSCPQPVVNGTPATTYQADVKNRWPDGSVKFAVIGLIADIPANGSAPVFFQDGGTCNNDSGLTQAQMLNFDAGSGPGAWDADIEVTAGGSTQATDAKTMLQNLSFGDCKLQYWQQGPVVTSVIVQDCTASSVYDFGWSWNGATMSNPVTGNAATASLHPMFILSFFPTKKTVQVDFVLENMWTGRGQDQQYSVKLKTGNPLTSVYSSAGQPYADSSGIFTQLYGTRWIKTFFSGTPLGHIRIDHNFPYLVSTQLLANYDQVNASVSPDSPDGTCALLSNNSYAASDYQCFIGTYPGVSDGDKGDITGHALIQRAMNSGNDKGKLMSREELDYLYNMRTCGDANGACAKAWYILTGETGAADTNLSAAVPGGGGMWEAFAQFPFHFRESRTGGSFYCSGYDTANTTLSSGCGSGAGNTTGHGISRHAYPTTGQSSYGSVAPLVGTVNRGPWSFDDGSAHWVDFSYPHYLLTGSYFAMEEVQQGANWGNFSLNPDPAFYDGNGAFTFFNWGAGARGMTWALLQNAYAGMVSPDGTAEQTYYSAVLRANAAVMEGYYGTTGTALTPSSRNTSCSGYPPFSATPANATRWDFGHCGRGLGIFPTLHNPATGSCWSQEIYISQQAVTAASANGGTASLTVGSVNNLLESVNIWGATGAWSVINTEGFQSDGSRGVNASGSGTTLTVPCPVPGQSGSCSGLGALTGNVQVTAGSVDQTAASDFSEEWMNYGYGLVLNRLIEMGFTSWSSLATEMNDRLLEMVEDSNFNPYLIGVYEMPAKNGPMSGSFTGCTTGITTNPFLPTWASVKQAIVPPLQTQSTFNGAAGDSACGVDHAYAVTARAMGTFLPGLTDNTDPNLLGQGSAAWGWLNSHVPFYGDPITGTAPCNTGQDSQVPLALAPRSGGAGTSSGPRILIFTANPSTIQPGQSSALTWSVLDATSVVINNGIGTVVASTSIIVNPSQTTNYTMTAFNANGQTVHAITVTIGGGGNPPVNATAGRPLSVQVYPNPWRSDKHSGHPSITFAGLISGTTIKLFTVSGHKVKELHTDVPSIPWDLTNDSGDKVASGIYLYVITDSAGDKVKGKVAVIK